MAIDTFSISGSPISASSLNATLEFEHEALLREPADLIISGQATLNKPRSGLGGIYNFTFRPATAADVPPDFPIRKYLDKMYAPVTIEPITAIAELAFDGKVSVEQIIADMPKAEVSFPSTVDIQVNFSDNLVAFEDELLLHGQLPIGEYGFHQTSDVFDHEPKLPRLSFHGLSADIEVGNIYDQARAEDQMMFEEFNDITDDQILDLI